MVVIHTLRDSQQAIVFLFSTKASLVKKKKIANYIAVFVFHQVLLGTKTPVHLLEFAVIILAGLSVLHKNTHAIARPDCAQLPGHIRSCGAD